MRNATGLAAAVMLCICGSALAQDETSGAAAPAETAPPIRKIDEHRYQVGTVVLDAQARTVRCRGEVNMNEGGPIELLACTERGKVHESVFILDLKPLDLQVALLLLDMQLGRNPACEYSEDDPDRLKEPGTQATLFVEWEATGADGGPERRRERAERFLYNVEEGRPLGDVGWVFLGSQMVAGRLGAEVGGTLVSTYRDPLAILELAHPTVNDDIWYETNKELCPPIGTKVELVIEAPARADEQTGGEAAAGP
jgi:hypothetical protein